MTRSFASASTLEDALAALGDGARPVAGGTDLVVGARQGKAPLPEAIIAIDRIAALEGIVDDGGGLRLGALVTHDEIVASAVIRDAVHRARRCFGDRRLSRDARTRARSAAT